MTEKRNTLQEPKTVSVFSLSISSSFSKKMGNKRERKGKREDKK